MSQVKKSIEATEVPGNLTDWPDLDLTIEELDEPVFQPQQVVPNASSLNEIKGVTETPEIEPVRRRATGS